MLPVPFRSPLGHLVLPPFVLDAGQQHLVQGRHLIKRQRVNRETLNLVVSDVTPVLSSDDASSIMPDTLSHTIPGFIIRGCVLDCLRQSDLIP